MNQQRNKQEEGRDSAPGAEQDEENLRQRPQEKQADQGMTRERRAEAGADQDTEQDTEE